MVRDEVQCPNCGEAVEVFVDGRIEDVRSTQDASPSGFWEGFERGLSDIEGYEKDCPFCSRSLTVLHEP